MVIQYGSVATDYIHTVGSRKTEKENKEIYFSRKNQKNRLLRFPDCSRYCDNLYLSYRKGIHSATTHTVLTSTHKSEVTLPDGTIVWLNNNTKLIYPEAFSSTERSVYLEGEAYFKVTKNKARPFVVKSQGQEIKVLGTSFNVRNRPNEDLAETTLISGAVSLRFNNDSVPVRLNPNEQITYYKSIYP